MADDEVVLTPEQMVQQEMASRILCRRNLLPFVMRFKPSYDPGWVHKDICRRLEKFSDDIANKKSPRLMLFMPPRSGKSELVSRNFPAWHLGRHPDHEVITTSYSSSLALKFSRSVRTLLREPGYAELFPNCALDSDTQAAEAWMTTKGGGLMAAGVSGPLTGNGMHCVHFQVTAPTKRGILRITDIRVGDEVIGYDHERNEYCWTPVLAVSTQYKSEFVSVNGVICTPDHRVWTDDRGYVEASEVGDSGVMLLTMRGYVPTGTKRACAEYSQVRPRNKTVLFRCLRFAEAGGRQIQLWVREQKSRARDYLQSVLSKWEGSTTGMQTLQRPDFAGSVGTCAVGHSYWRAYKCILLSGLLRLISTSAPRTAEGHRAMFNVQSGDMSGYEIQSSAAVLQQSVLSRAKSIYRGVFRELVRFAQGGSQTRWEAVPELRVDGSSQRGASYRSQCGELGTGELDPSVRAVPQPLSSSVLGTCASDLAPLLQVRSGERVVDIQTGTSNFFAGVNPVLLHNCGILDDVVKNREEAESMTIREAAKEWYTSTFYTRLAPGGGILVVMTRWHHDDLAGWLLEEAKHGGDQWEVVAYPAIAEEDEVYRNKGEALHPSRYPVETLEKIKSAIGPRDFTALYQQRPTAEEGAFFKREWVDYYDPFELPGLSELTVYTAWDLAIGKNSQNDETVGVTVGVDRDQKIWVLDVIHGRWDAHEICVQILDSWRRWRPIKVGIERGHIFMTLGPLLERLIAERKDWEFPFDPDGLKPGRADKMARAAPIQGRMRQGYVRLPRHASWLSTFIQQLLEFPNGVHDDIVDAYAWIGQMINEFITVPLPRAKRKESWKDRLDQHMAKNGMGSGHMGF